MGKTPAKPKPPEPVDPILEKLVRESTRLRLQSEELVRRMHDLEARIDQVHQKASETHR